MGGDEFTILLDDLKDPSEATVIADRILRDLKDPFTSAKRKRLEASVSGSLFQLRGRLSEEILRASDSALHQAKNMGKARYEVFDQIMRSIRSPRSNWKRISTRPCKTASFSSITSLS